ncbi:uncharacterized protein LOC112551408 [Alligator sinensis]|uniref:Uncharacterized protein LOC112551408 n=1 Tax=Alligator sinensis TaxID=38654 RepID=A0A3Q0HCG4_ALLSI|nr:uncharacterized protein LOC112551408 [Alligator sinensis]
MISHNMTWIRYPSSSWDSSTNIEDVIASQNIISRFMHCYIAFFVPAGLLTGILILIIFIKEYLQHRILENLNIFLLDFTISNIAMIFFSFTVIPRPGYLKATHLGCGALSFFFNVSYFNSQYLLILMLLTLLGPFSSRASWITRATQSPLLCVGFILTCAFCMSLVVVALLGTDNYHVNTDCQVDPLFAWPEYEIIKFTFGFGIPLILQLLCFILFFIKAAQSEAGILRKNIHIYMLVITITMFACRLFYNVMILYRTMLKIQESIGTFKTELMMNIAEIILFIESCVSLIFILCLHKPLKNGIAEIIAKCKRTDATNNRPDLDDTNAL